MYSHQLTSFSRPKDQPKPAKASRGENTRGRGERGGRRGAKASRGKPKTAQQLDAEMTDYFDAGTGADTSAMNSAAPATNGGEDLGMDGVSVSIWYSMNLACAYNVFSKYRDSLD